MVDCFVLSCNGTEQCVQMLLQMKQPCSAGRTMERMGELLL